MAPEPEALPGFSPSRREGTESLVPTGIVGKIEHAVIVGEISMATDQTESFFHALARLSWPIFHGGARLLLCDDKPPGGTGRRRAPYASMADSDGFALDALWSLYLGHLSFQKDLEQIHALSAALEVLLPSPPLIAR